MNLYRSFILFLLLFCASTGALATDISIASSVIPNFNPQNIGSDVVLTNNVSVTNGSAVATCAICLRSNWVGVGGFRIRINGVDYTVSHVNDRSTIQLTTNYTGVTSATATVTWFKYVELRLYANQSFQPLGETYVVQAGAVGSSAWYRRIAASILNEFGVNNLYIPALGVDATTDAPTNNTARYTAAFYRPDNGGIIQYYGCFESFVVPPTTPTSWTALCTFNQSVNIATDNTTYSRTQIDSFRASCLTGKGVYYASDGQVQSCLTFGAGLTLTGGTLSASGSSPPYREITSSGALLAADGVIYADATSGAITLSLPAASTVNQSIYYAKKFDSSANALIIDPNGAELIGGASTFSITSSMGEIAFQSINTGWRIVGDYNLSTSVSTIRTVTTTGSVTSADGTILCDPTLGPVTLNVGALSTFQEGARLTFKRLDVAATGVCLIDFNASETADSYWLQWEIISPADTITFQKSGSTWHSVAH